MRYVSLAALAVGMMTVCEAQAAAVKDIQINGLERVEPETVSAYLEIEPGQDVSQLEIDTALKRLYETGLFSDVSLDMLGNGVLSVKVLENPIVNKRYFEGNKDNVNVEYSYYKEIEKQNDGFFDLENDIKFKIKVEDENRHLIKSKSQYDDYLKNPENYYEGNKYLKDLSGNDRIIVCKLNSLKSFSLIAFFSSVDSLILIRIQNSLLLSGRKIQLFVHVHVHFSFVRNHSSTSGQPAWPRCPLYHLNQECPEPMAFKIILSFAGQALKPVGGQRGFVFGAARKASGLSIGSWLLPPQAQNSQSSAAKLQSGRSKRSSPAVTVSQTPAP